ncbi:maleylacetate reductase [Pseudonocardia xishanensis]|uniref:Maleylacetate reductase n=1 Tax=Pseudonocardia xishanensis TaxID=630995 RepID=A0ABP8RVP7_9PSEU
MTRQFVHDQRAVRVVFRRGALDAIGDEVERLGAQRVLLIGSPRHADRVSALLGERVAATVSAPRMHVPAEQARFVQAQGDALDVDACVAVGGGSATGLAKVVALHRRIPILAAPTTLSGSEMTRVWGMTTAGVKQTGRDEAAAPRIVLYDPDLLATLPVATAVPSAVNALAHAVEALWAPDRTPLTDLYAREGAAAIGRALRGAGKTELTELVTEALYGAWLSGMCLDSTTMSLHHKLCHVLGGSFGLPHAETHTVVLPHVIAFNAGHAAPALHTLREALDMRDPARGLHSLVTTLGGPGSLAELGLRSTDLDRATDLALASPYANPRPLTADVIRTVLEGALRGDEPTIA